MDDARFAELLGQCRGALERLTHIKISAYADAEDVVQECCLAAYRAKDTLRDEKLFRAWILQICRNCISQHYRRRGRRREDYVDAVPERACGNMRGRDDVADAFAKLSADDRNVLRLYYYVEETSVRETAALLNVPEGTVKSRLHNARGRFRDAYRQWEDIYI